MAIHCLQLSSGILTTRSYTALEYKITYPDYGQPLPMIFFFFPPSWIQYCFKHLLLNSLHPIKLLVFTKPWPQGLCVQLPGAKQRHGNMPSSRQRFRRIQLMLSGVRVLHRSQTMASYSALGLWLALGRCKQRPLTGTVLLTWKQRNPTFISVVNVSAWEQCQSSISQPGWRAHKSAEYVHVRVNTLIHQAASLGILSVLVLTPFCFY